MEKEVKNSKIHAVNNISVKSINDIKQIIKSTPKNQSITITFSLLLKQAVHPQDNTPIIHFDQLLTINYQHAPTINNTEPWLDPLYPLHTTDDQIYASMESNHVVPKLARKYLQKQVHWPAWNQARFHQLNMYHTQQMFCEPEQIPKDVNIILLLWFYHVKPSGIQKAWYLVNGSKHMKGTVTLGKTYAAALEQPRARLFWALIALHNNIVIEANASNAYTAVNPPVAPFYIKVYDHY